MFVGVKKEEKGREIERENNNKRKKKAVDKSM